MEKDFMIDPKEEIFDGLNGFRILQGLKEAVTKPCQLTGGADSDAFQM